MAAQWHSCIQMRVIFDHPLLYWVNMVAVALHMEIIINVALSVQMPPQLILLTCHSHPGWLGPI